MLSKHFVIIGLATALTIVLIYLLSNNRISIIPFKDNNLNETHILSKQAPMQNRKRAFNVGPTEYDEDLKQEFNGLVERRCPPDDPDLIRAVQDMIDEPSLDHPFKYGDVFKTPQADFVNNYLNKNGGYFVECGAYDGSISSNTLFLENKRGWTGLLVEMDPFLYTQIMGKNRRVSAINVCLSLQKYPTQLHYKETNTQLGELILETQNNSNLSSAPCVPFETLMTALNRKHVDYFSLDVEGYELDVLQTIPFDRINIDVLSVEYRHVRQGKKALRDFMALQGYSLEETISYSNGDKKVWVEDDMYVKNSLVKKAKKKHT